MDNILIRPAVLQDYNSFNKIHSMGNDVNAQYAPHVLRHAETSITIDMYIDQLNSSDYFLFVAQYKNILVGIISAELRTATHLPVLISRSYVHVSHLCILPEFRRQGIATQLLDCCGKWGKTKNAQSIEVMVMDKNEDAINTYEYNGMICIKRIYEKKL